MLRDRLVCKLFCGKGWRKPKGFAPARREGRVACLATLRLLCCYSAAQGGRSANAPPERDGRVALLATLKLLCGGGLEGATAAPLLLRRGRQSYSAPYCLGEASRFTSFPNLRLLRGRLWAPATSSGGRRPCTFYTFDAWEQLGAFGLHRLHAAVHMRAAAAGGLTPTTRWTPAGV